MPINDSWYTSNRDDWETPQALFDVLDEHFNFVYDLATNGRNAKVANYFTKEDDALAQDWGGIGEASDWLYCNPPYGREIRDWIKKASESNKNIVMLIPARTDTSYWHDFIFNKASVVFLRGRLKFEINGEARDAAPFPSALVIYREKSADDGKYTYTNH